MKTDFKDDVFTGNRKYQVVNNDDGTISLIDVTDYQEEGSTIDAALMTEITTMINSLQHMLEANDITCEINVGSKDNPEILVDADRTPIILKWKYKELR